MINNFTLLKNSRLRIFMDFNELISDKKLEVSSPCLTLGGDNVGDGGGKFYIVESGSKPGNIDIPNTSLSLRECGGFGGSGGSTSGVVSTYTDILSVGETEINTGITSLTSNPAVFVAGQRILKDYDFTLSGSTITLKKSYSINVPVYVEDIAGFRTYVKELPKGQTVLNTGMKNFTDYTQIYANGLKLAEHMDYEFDRERGILSLYIAYQDNVIICIDDMVKNSTHVPVATTTNVGAVMVGDGLTIDTTGKLSLSGAYVGNFNVTGNIYCSGNVSGYSDIRLKENIQLISEPLEKLSKIGGYTFDIFGTPSVGLIAQEVEEILPQLVTEDENGIKAVAYDKMVGLLVECIKSNRKDIEELKRRLMLLERGKV
ncbi:MAG: tail fiber domain-containing protein [Peptostreptococcaceae bacterium]